MFWEQRPDTQRNETKHIQKRLPNMVVLTALILVEPQYYKHKNHQNTIDNKHESTNHHHHHHHHQYQYRMNTATSSITTTTKRALDFATRTITRQRQVQQQQLLLVIIVVVFLIHSIVPHQQQHPSSLLYTTRGIGAAAAVAVAFHPPPPSFPSRNRRSTLLHNRYYYYSSSSSSFSSSRRSIPVSALSDPQEESNHDDITESVAAAASATTIASQGNMKSNEASSSANSTATAAVNSNNNNTVQRKTWNPFRLAVLRWKMTEPAMTSPLNYGNYKDDDASFHCAYCDHVLFPSNAKYNSGTGWPSFWRTAQTNAVAYHREWDGRLECRCAKCQSHLGHVFLDGPYPSSITNQELVQSIPSTDPKSSSSSKNECLPRFCVNGLALTYQKDQSSTLSSSTVSK